MMQPRYHHISSGVPSHACASGQCSAQFGANLYLLFFFFFIDLLFENIKNFSLIEFLWP